MGFLAAWRPYSFNRHGLQFDFRHGWRWACLLGWRRRVRVRSSREVEALCKSIDKSCELLSVYVCLNQCSNGSQRMKKQFEPAIYTLTLNSISVSALIVLLVLGISSPNYILKRARDVFTPPARRKTVHPSSTASAKESPPPRPQPFSAPSPPHPRSWRLHPSSVLHLHLLTLAA